MSREQEITSASQGPHESLVDRALAGPDLTAEHHLANCTCCQMEKEAIEKALQHFADVQREQANRPETFWERQAAKIRETRQQKAEHRSSAWVWIPALATAIVLLAVVLRPGAPKSPVPQATVLTDQQVLTEVERAVEGGTPMALEPVSLYAEQDLENSSSPNSNFKKEPLRHEN